MLCILFICYFQHISFCLAGIRANQMRASCCFWSGSKFWIHTDRFSSSLQINVFILCLCLCFGVRNSECGGLFYDSLRTAREQPGHYRRLNRNARAGNKMACNRILAFLRPFQNPKNSAFQVFDSVIQSLEETRRPVYFGV